MKQLVQAKKGSCKTMKCIGNGKIDYGICNQRIIRNEDLGQQD
jgi:hypothetical protein